MISDSLSTRSRRHLRWSCRPFTRARMCTGRSNSDFACHQPRGRAAFSELFGPALKCSSNSAYVVTSVFRNERAVESSCMPTSSSSAAVLVLISASSRSCMNLAIGRLTSPAAAASRSAVGCSNTVLMSWTSASVSSFASCTCLHRMANELVPRDCFSCSSCCRRSESTCFSAKYSLSLLKLSSLGPRITVPTKVGTGTGLARHSSCSCFDSARHLIPASFAISPKEKPASEK